MSMNSPVLAHGSTLCPRLDWFPGLPFSFPPSLSSHPESLCLNGQEVFFSAPIVFFPAGMLISTWDLINSAAN